MTTELLTVNEEDVVDMAAAVMRWRHVRRIPVEDDQHHLVGLVTYRSLLRVFSERDGRTPIPVREVMQRDIVTVSPETSALEALRLMQERRIACLPVRRPRGAAGRHRHRARLHGDGEAVAR